MGAAIAGLASATRELRGLEAMSLERRRVEDGFAITVREPVKVTAERPKEFAYGLGDIGAAGGLAVLLEVSRPPSIERIMPTVPRSDN